MDASGRRFLLELEQLVTRCLAKQPEDRFQSVNDVAIALKKLAAGEGYLPASTSAFPTRPCVAVLPVQNFCANKIEAEYLVDGMTEVLIAELARSRALRIVSRTTVLQLKDSRMPLRQIGRELDADAVVEGSVLLAGPSVRITAQLIRADMDEHLWAESYQWEVRDSSPCKARSPGNRPGDQARALRRGLPLRVAARPGDCPLENPFFF
jgi:TolB-like protein